jgi:hypothetical protein
LPGHDPLACTDYLANVEIDGLAPERRLIVRGLCLDIEDRLWLRYAWQPGLTESMGEDSGVSLNVEYYADVRLSSEDYVCSYSVEGGPSSDGEIGYERPPKQARRIWFDFAASADPEAKGEVTRVTFDLHTGQVAVEKALGKGDPLPVRLTGSRQVRQP